MTGLKTIKVGRKVSSTVTQSDIGSTPVFTNTSDECATVNVNYSWNWATGTLGIYVDVEPVILVTAGATGNNNLAPLSITVGAGQTMYAKVNTSSAGNNITVSASGNRFVNG